MAGQVRFTVDVQTAAAVSGFLKIVEAQKKVESGQKQIASASKEQDSVLGAMVGKIGAVVAAYASFESVKTIIRNVTEEILAGNAALLEFWKTASVPSIFD